MNLYQPDWLYLLLLLPLVVGIWWLAQRRLRQRLSRFLGAAPSRLVVNARQPRPVLRLLLLLVALAAIVVALARPRWGFEWREVSRQGVDIMVAIDVSQSMRAQDLSPNRLSRAKREIVDLLQLLEGDRIGLLVFAGVAFVQCPLTVDYQAVEMFLDHLSTDLIPVPGTAIGAAIRQATTSLTESDSDESAGKALILITDGEDHGSEPLAAAQAAKEAGIEIYTIGVGAREGAPVPSKDGGFVRDKSGQIVLSRLQDQDLKEIAEVTDGRYVRSVSGDFDLDQIYFNSIKQNLTKGTLYEKRERLWYERFFWFSALAIFLLLIEMLWAL
jgi:Ca-activated chloride channel family protein